MMPDPITRSKKYDGLPECLTPEECRQYLGIGRVIVYDLLRRGEAPSVEFGRLIRVPKSTLQRNTDTPNGMLRCAYSLVELCIPEGTSDV